MSYEEKGQWVYLIANVLAFGGYVAVVLGQVGSRPLTDVDYVPALLGAIGAAIALSVVGRVAVEVVHRSDTFTADVRDRDIGRLGEYFGGTVLGIAMIVPFVLTVLEVDHFWIGNAIYVAFAASAFIGTAVKLVAYRRGI